MKFFYKPSEAINKMICTNKYACTDSDYNYSKKAINLLNSKIIEESVICKKLPMISSINIHKVKVELSKTLHSLKNTDPHLCKYFKATCKCFSSQFNSLFDTNTFISIPNIEDVLEAI